MRAAWQRLRRGVSVLRRVLARQALTLFAIECRLLFLLVLVLALVAPSIAGSNPGTVRDQADTTAAAVIPSDWKPLFTDNLEDGSAERWELSRPEGSAGMWKIEAEGDNHDHEEGHQRSRFRG